MLDATLESERLLIRPFKLGDEEDVFAFSSDEEVNRYTGDIMRTSLNDAKKIITDVWLPDYKNYGYGRFAVIYKPENKIIGFNGFKYHPDLDFTDFGYRFLSQYWGKGIATESSKMLLEYGFNNLPIDEVLGFVMEENKASSVVLKKIGFQYLKYAGYPGEGEEKKYEWYSITKKEYESLKISETHNKTN